MSKQCNQCSKTMIILPKDKEMYARFAVPEPTLCPDCRNQRRLAFRQERTLYARQCDRCRASIIAVYPAETPYTVYCHDCWWNDSWNPTEYGRPVDFTRPFFEQLNELWLAVPRVATVGAHNENCEYVNYVNYSKDSYLIYGCNDADRCLYSWRIHHSKDSVDGVQVTSCELCYYAIDVEDSYNTHFSYQCRACTDSAFLYDCQGSRNCFLSSNLRNAQYVFKNKQLTQEQYQQAIADYDLASYGAQRRAWEEFKVMLKKTAIHRSANFIHVENCTGDNLIKSKDCYYSFAIVGGDNVRYAFYGEDITDVMDVTLSGWPGELMYETMSGGVHCYNMKFCAVCWSCHDIEYSDNCHHSNNLFGCTAIRTGQYVILNKQYTKADYIKLRTQLVDHMRTTNEYGEYFPVQFSPFSYNETLAHEFYPLQRAAVLSRQWQWQDHLPSTTGQETMPLAEVPDHLRDCPDSLLDQVLACRRCNRNYKIIPQELQFYRRVGLAIPQLCPNCRHDERMAVRNPLHLWRRQCMCPPRLARESGEAGTQPSHQHGSQQCTTEFETTYDPAGLEIVYCNKCYQKEIY